MLKRIKRLLQRDERGITGLETAIILIAFVVVASVFAYTVLSAGIFSSQKGQEAIYEGLEETRASMAVRGSVIGYGANSCSVVGNIVTANESTLWKIAVTLTNTLDGQAIDLTPAWSGGATGNLTATGDTNVCIVAYADQNQYIGDVAWTLSWAGKNDGDNLLESEEKAVMYIHLLDYRNATHARIGNNAVGLINSFANCPDAYDTVTFEIRPETGAALIIERTLPARLDDIMDLN